MKIERSRCVVFPLVLKGEWYKMIASGEKREEYRDFTPRYQTRFRNFQKKCNAAGCVESFGRDRDGRPVAVVAFSLGYTKPDMFFSVRLALVEDKTLRPICNCAQELNAGERCHRNVTQIRSGSAHPEWGEPNKKHFVIQLGERVEFVEDSPLNHIAATLGRPEGDAK